jgi:hypothetical protein
MIDFEYDVMRYYNNYPDKIATAMLMTIDDITIFGTGVYNEYLDIFESAKKVVDVSENQDYTVLSFLDSNELEILKMSVPPKLGAAFLSNPGIHRATTQSYEDGSALPHKWDKVGLGWKLVDGEFVDLGIGGPLDLLSK